MKALARVLPILVLVLVAFVIMACGPAAPQNEGELSTIALPDDWLNYGEMKAAFLKKFPNI